MESKIKELITKLYDDNGIVRLKARLELIEIGKPVIDFFIGLQYAKEHQVRWEVLKTLSQLAVPESIPILVNALENEDLDVRWLAAHGLIQIGKDSIKPVLEALEGNQDSKYLREGVHHVLVGLKNKHSFDDEYGMIKMLEQYSSQSKLSITAKLILSNGKK